MYILGNFLIALSKVVDIVLSMVSWMIFFRAILSWVNPDPFNPIVQFLNRTTEPILQPFRRIFPSRGIDISPILAYLAIIFLQFFLVASLRDLGNNMRQRQTNSTPLFEEASFSNKEDLKFKEDSQFTN